MCAARFRDGTRSQKIQQIVCGRRRGEESCTERGAGTITGNIFTALPLTPAVVVRNRRTGSGHRQRTLERQILTT